jgi:hypothetical protein
LKLQIQKQGGRRLEAPPEFSQVGEDTIIGAASWLDDRGTRHERFQVITVGDEQIVGVQGCASRRQADRLARRAARAR